MGNGNVYGLIAVSYTHLYGLWKSKIYPIIDAHSCITAIYLGCNMPDEYQKVIIDPVSYTHL